jgi:hypothetical protein
MDPESTRRSRFCCAGSGLFYGGLVVVCAALARCAAIGICATSAATPRRLRIQASSVFVDGGRFP